MDWLFDAICHRHPQRSFLLGAEQVLLCARCTGIYLGALAGGLSAAWWHLRGGLPRGGLVSGVLLIGILITPAEVWLESTGLCEGTRLVRCVTGLVTGSALIYAMALPLLGTRARTKPPSARWVAVPFMIDGLLLAALAWAVHSGEAAVLLASLLVCGIGLIAFSAVTNLGVLIIKRG